MMTFSSRASWPRVSAVVGAVAVMLGQPLSGAAATGSIRGQAGQVTPIPQRPTVQLTMDQAVAMALEHNLALKGARISLPIADQGIAGARAAFLPNLTASFNRQSSLSPPSFSFQGTDDINALTLTSSTHGAPGAALVRRRLSARRGARGAAPRRIRPRPSTRRWVRR